MELYLARYNKKWKTIQLLTLTLPGTCSERRSGSIYDYDKWRHVISVFVVIYLLSSYLVKKIVHIG